MGEGSPRAPNVIELGEFPQILKKLGEIRGQRSRC